MTYSICTSFTYDSINSETHFDISSKTFACVLEAGWMYYTSKRPSVQFQFEKFKASLNYDSEIDFRELGFSDGDR